MFPSGNAIKIAALSVANTKNKTSMRGEGGGGHLSLSSAVVTSWRPCVRECICVYWCLCLCALAWLWKFEWLVLFVMMMSIPAPCFVLVC